MHKRIKTTKQNKNNKSCHSGHCCQLEKQVESKQTHKKRREQKTACLSPWTATPVRALQTRPRLSRRISFFGCPVGPYIQPQDAEKLVRDQSTSRSHKCLK